MSKSIRDVAEAVAALGALPVQAGTVPPPVDIVDQREQAEAWEGHVLGAWDGEFAMESGLDRAVLKLARMVQADVAELERLRARVAEADAQREALAERLRAGQQWQRGRTPELVGENFVSQSELRSIFGIPLVAPWRELAEDPCHPCGCPKRFNRHADGCPTLPEGEHYAIVHHDYPKGRDLPEREDPARCLKVHPFSPRDGWRMVCGNCDHGKNADCHQVGA